jgi:hypothetical protein
VSGVSPQSGDSQADFATCGREPVGGEHGLGALGPQNSCDPLPIEVSETGDRVYRCCEADQEIQDLQRTLGLSGSALVCRVSVRIRSEVLAACIDTGMTFTLLDKRTYDSRV